MTHTSSTILEPGFNTIKGKLFYFKSESEKAILVFLCSLFLVGLHYASSFCWVRRVRARRTPIYGGIKIHVLTWNCYNANYYEYVWVPKKNVKDLRAISEVSLSRLRLRDSGDRSDCVCFYKTLILYANEFIIDKKNEEASCICVGIIIGISLFVIRILKAQTHSGSQFCS